MLVLAGDIGYLGDVNYVSHPFWDFVADSFKEVLELQKDLDEIGL